MPLRHHLHHAQRLLVELGTHALHHRRLNHRAVFVNNELHNHATLRAFVCSLLRIFDILHEEVHQFLLAAREPRHLFHHVEHLAFHDRPLCLCFVLSGCAVDGDTSHQGLFCGAIGLCLLRSRSGFSSFLVEVTGHEGHANHRHQQQVFRPQPAICTFLVHHTNSKF